MAQTERLANLGYLGLKKETTKGTAVTPNVYVPLFKSNLTTDTKLSENNPIVGVKFSKYQEFMGMRTHVGSLEVIAEPNTAEYFFDMLMTAGNITGSDPYTHPFTISASTDPNAYTIDIQNGQVVHRYFGVQAESIEPAFDNDVMHFNIDVSALGSFIVREIATVNTTTITLKTDYDPTPNKGLVASDLVKIMKADGSSSLNTTVSSVDADGITVVLGNSAASFAAGDFIYLRAATASYTLQTPFLWGRTEFRFGTTASGALSATHTPVEPGSKWKLMHSFSNKDGEHRSGSFDPASLPRTQAESQATVKTFYDLPDYVNRYLKVGGYALVIRHFSGSYELRITYNNIIGKGPLKIDLETGKLIYQDYDFEAVYNTSDGQAFDVKVINALSS